VIDISPSPKSLVAAVSKNLELQFDCLFPAVLSGTHDNITIKCRDNQLVHEGRLTDDNTEIRWGAGHSNSVLSASVWRLCKFEEESVVVVIDGAQPSGLGKMISKSEDIFVEMVRVFFSSFSKFVLLRCERLS
jgi:hypothetical protein